MNKYLLHLYTVLFFFFITSVHCQVTQATDKVTFLGVSATGLSAPLSDQLDLPLGIYLIVEQVSAESPAELSGLKLHDVLLKMDDQILVNSRQLKALVRVRKPNDRIALHILRKGEPQTLYVKLTEIEHSGNHLYPPTRLSPERDLFYRDLDRIFPHVDPSIRDLLQRHGFSPSPDPQPPTRQGGGSSPSLESPIHGPGLTDVQSFSYSTEQKYITTTDEMGTFEYSVKDGNQYLRAINPAGEEIFNGSVTTHEDREKLPPELLTKLQNIESRL